MATPLDIGLLQNVSIIFPFLLVLVLVYALLSITKIFGAENKGLYAFIAFLLAVSTLFSPVVTQTINLMAPWFVLLFIFSIFLLIGFQIFGVEQKTIVGLITGAKHGDTFFYWVLTLVLIIALGSLSAVISNQHGFKSLSTGDNTTVVQQGGESTGFFGVLFNPKVLGMVLLLMIAMFTVRNLASSGD
jgi:hypothetical protein